MMADPGPGLAAQLRSREADTVSAKALRLAACHHDWRLRVGTVRRDDMMITSESLSTSTPRACRSTRRVSGSQGAESLRCRPQLVLRVSRLGRTRQAPVRLRRAGRHAIRARQPQSSTWRFSHGGYHAGPGTRITTRGQTPSQARKGKVKYTDTAICLSWWPA